jgi:Pyruvate/2-oxoacid:ferredoxin oxidoreductase delta subunit
MQRATAAPPRRVERMAAVTIDLACINCAGRRVCPTETIKYFATGHARTSSSLTADDCGICAPVCPVACIYPVEDASSRRRDSRG